MDISILAFLKAYVEKIIDKGGGSGNFVPKNQGQENAGKFLIVGTDGNVTAVAIDEWNGGIY